MQIGKNYITDIYEPPSSSLPNGKSINWYQFRVPVAEFQKGLMIYKILDRFDL